MKQSRRHFLRSSAALAAATGLPLWFAEESLAQNAPPSLSSPNDRPRIAWIGCGGRGSGIIREAAKHGDVVAVCDVDAGHLDKAAATFPKARRFQDFRKTLDQDGIDVVVNATPDHWHTLVNLRAMRTGRDVYSEKPLTLTIAEGKRLVLTSKETGRILQTGSQQRSDDRFRLACELARNQVIGRLERIETALPAGLHAGPFAPAPTPEGLDWDFWLGQAPKIDYVPQRCHGTFRYFYDYSGGTMTDWGAHHNDIAMWGNGTDGSGPVSVEGKILVPPVEGGYTAASEYRVRYTYANGVTHDCFSVNWDGFDGSVKGPVPEGQTRNGVKFIGADGWVFVSRSKIEASRPEILKDLLPAGAVRLEVSKNHMGNFFECVRSRKQPICRAEIGHRSVSVCHLGVLALRLGRKLQWDPAKEDFAGDAEASSYVGRVMRAPWSLDAA
jgi:predicted dehydrogenase